MSSYEECSFGPIPPVFQNGTDDEWISTDFVISSNHDITVEDAWVWSTMDEEDRKDRMKATYPVSQFENRYAFTRVKYSTTIDGEVVEKYRKWSAPNLINEDNVGFKFSNTMVLTPIVNIDLKYINDRRVLHITTKPMALYSGNGEHISTSYFIESLSGTKYISRPEMKDNLTSISIDVTSLPTDEYLLIKVVHHTDVNQDSYPSRDTCIIEGSHDDYKITGDVFIGTPSYLQLTSNRFIGNFKYLVRNQLGVIIDNGTGGENNHMKLNPVGNDTKTITVTVILEDNDEEINETFYPRTHEYIKPKLDDIIWYDVVKSRPVDKLIVGSKMSRLGDIDGRMVIPYIDDEDAVRFRISSSQHNHFREMEDLAIRYTDIKQDTLVTVISVDSNIVITTYINNENVGIMKIYTYNKYASVDSLLYLLHTINLGTVNDDALIIEAVRYHDQLMTVIVNDTQQTIDFVSGMIVRSNTITESFINYSMAHLRNDEFLLIGNKKLYKFMPILGTLEFISDIDEDYDEYGLTLLRRGNGEIVITGISIDVPRPFRATIDRDSLLIENHMQISNVRYLPTIGLRSPQSFIHINYDNDDEYVNVYDF